MKQSNDFSSLEARFREARFYDWRGDARGVKSRYEAIRRGKEAYMSKSPLRLVAVFGALLLLIGGGLLGMNWLFQQQRAERLMSGEAISVAMTIGEVSVKRMGTDEWQELAVDDTIEMGDTIRTGEDAACELHIVDRGVYRLEANTTMLVSRLVNEDDALQAKVNIERGTMSLKPGSLRKGEVFEVETSTAVAAVRGTIFMVSVTEEGDTRVAVTEGKVVVTPRVGSIEAARTSAVLDEMAYRALRETVAAPIGVLSNEEVVLTKAAVERIDRSVARVIETTAAQHGPITLERVADVKATIVNEVVGTNVAVAEGAPSLTAVMVQRKEITEEARRILDNVTHKKPVGQRHVRVSFESDVVGATVLLNGVTIGKSPLTRLLDDGQVYTVVFEKEGYERVSQELNLVSGTNIAVVLTALAVPAQTNEVPAEAAPEVVRAEPAAQPTNVVRRERAAQPTNVVREEVAQAKPGDMVWERPFKEMVSDTMVVVDRGGAAQDTVVTTFENRITVLNLEGEVLRSFVVGDGTTFEFPLVATATSIFTRDDAGFVYSYDYDGNVRWRVRLPKTPAWTGLFLGKAGIVVSVVQHKVHILNADTGAITKTIDATGQLYSTPVMVDDRLLVFAQENGTVVGYDTVAGATLWQKDLGKRFTLPLYAVDTGERKVVVLPIQGGLLGVDALTGNVIWEREISGATFAMRPIVANDRLYVAHRRRIEVINMLTGEVVRRITMKDNVLALHADRRAVYILAQDGQVRVVSHGGVEMWEYQAGAGARSMAVHREGVYVFKSGSLVRLLNEAPQRR